MRLSSTIEGGYSRVVEIMDRFEWGDGELNVGESVITAQNGVRLYDGESKTSFNHGEVVLTTHRIDWKNSTNVPICLRLSYVVYVEEEPARIGKSPQIVLHLNPPQPDRLRGPVQHSPNSYVKLSFKEGGKANFHQCLQSALNRRLWEQTVTLTSVPKAKAVGIVGIERKIQEKNQETSKNISKAFEDLSKLMGMARDMVALSKTISNKIKTKQGEISEDETIQFKSYLLSLGINDPVTKETHGSGVTYHKNLAKQLAEFIEKPLKESGGIMALTDVYCRINRARGLELLSPEDLINACKMLESLRLPVRLHVFDSGVLVLKLLMHDEGEEINRTMKLLEEKGSLTAEELSQIAGISVVLAKERLLSSEKLGRTCRDDSIEGLRFYPNLLLTRSDAG